MEGWNRVVRNEKLGGMFDFFNRKPAAVYLGVFFDKETSDLKVTEIKEDGPAEKAGLKVGDEIVAIDDTKLSERKDLFALLQKKKVGDEITVEVLRDGSTVKLSLKLAKRPE
jgi:S1-C subfamily serine protease